MKTMIADLYPDKSLGLVGFRFAKCGKGRDIKFIESTNARDLEKAIGKGKVIIVPNADLPIEVSNTYNVLVM